MKRRHSRRKGLLSLFLASLALSALFPAQDEAHAKLVTVQGRNYDIASPGEVIAGQVVLSASVKVSGRMVDLWARQRGASLAAEIPQANLFLLKFASARKAAVTVKSLQTTVSGPFRAYPNYKVSIPKPPESIASAQTTGTQTGLYQAAPVTPPAGADIYTTNDPALSNQYALWKIREPFCTLPSISTHGVAVLDTGVDYTHPDLTGRVISVFDYVDWDDDAMDENGHGTHCAGIIAAASGNGQGIRGVSPASTIYAYRVLNAEGSGSLFHLIKAIYSAAANGNVSVLAVSMGLTLEEGSPAYNDLKNAVDNTVITKGKILCAAAGNDADISLFQDIYTGGARRPVPAWIPSSFTVGATQEQDMRAAYSNYNVNGARSSDWAVTYTANFVDIVAPGSNILSTFPADQYQALSGTSAAAALVAGAGSRFWDQNPAMTNAQVMSALASRGVLLGPAAGFPVPARRLDLLNALGGQTVTGFQGQILHGEKGYALADVAVNAYNGGILRAATKTNRGGVYTLTGLDPTLSYTMRISRPGFLTRNAALGMPPADAVKSVQPEPLMPSRPTVTGAENWRFVVTWKGTQPGYYDWLYDNKSGPKAGSYPWSPFRYFNAAGMEANAFLRDPQGNFYYYANRGALGMSPYTMYMRDSASDGVPLESHLIQKQLEGVYSYWISADPNESGYGTLRYAPGSPSYPGKTTVMAFKGNTLRASVNATSATRTGSATRIWHVFNLDGDNLEIVNTIRDSAP